MKHRKIKRTKSQSLVYGSALLFVALSLVRMFLILPATHASYKRCEVLEVDGEFFEENGERHQRVNIVVDEETTPYVDVSRPYSEFAWIPESVVKNWLVYTPNHGLEANHYRIDVGDVSSLSLGAKFRFALAVELAPESLAYLHCNYPDPPPPPDQTIIKNSLQLAPALVLPSQPICYEKTAVLNWNGNPIWLTSQGNEILPLAIDDILEITVQNQQGTKTYRMESNTAGFGPVELTSYFQTGQNTVTTRIKDSLSPYCGGSAVWLVWEEGLSPPDETLYSIIENVAIKEARSLSKLKYDIPLYPWMHWIRAILRKGSDASVSLIAPDGTRYDANHPQVEYINTPEYVVLTAFVEDTAAGNWQLEIDVIEATEKSVFFLTVVGKQGEIESTDTLGPISTVHLSGTFGPDSWWYTSNVTATVNAIDEPNGSGIGQIQWRASSIQEWQDYIQPISFEQEGVYHLQAVATDRASNRELLPPVVFFGIDKTPPTTVGTVTCSRDMLGICRGSATVELKAQDNLSGVERTLYSVDGGAIWEVYTQPIILNNNGSHNLLYKSVDYAGNEEPPLFSGAIQILRYVAWADATLSSNKATTVSAQGGLHSNGNVSFTNNTTVSIDALTYLGQLSQSGNVSLTIGQQTQVSQPLPLPFYPLKHYRDRCVQVTGPLTISDTSPNYNQCLYVNGNVVIKTTGARGKWTVVSTGTITDQSTNARLEAWDTTNGILFFARNGYITRSTGAVYNGVIYSPYATIDGPFTNTTLNGALIGRTVSLGSGTTLNAIQSAGFPVSTHSLPLITPSLPKAETIRLSSLSDGSVGSLSFADEDVLTHNIDSGVWSMYLDGSDVGLGNTDIDAFSVLPDGSILLSVDSDTSIVGLGAVDDSDIIRFVPSSLGANTAGTLSWYFDGSDVGLTSSGEDVDAIDFTSDGKLVVSTLDSFSVTGVSGNDEDLIAFTAVQLGATTNGTWTMYFDGSDVGLNESSSEDISGTWIDAATSKIYLSTVGTFSVTGSAGDSADIFICAPSSLGTNTTCTFGPGLYWDGSLNGFSGTIDAFSLSTVP